MEVRCTAFNLVASGGCCDVSLGSRKTKPLFPTEFSRPVSSMCENHDGLSHRSASEQRRLRSPSVDEQETELEQSLEQDEEENEDQGLKMENDSLNNDSLSPTRKKEIMVVMGFLFCFLFLQDYQEKF